MRTLQANSTSGIAGLLGSRVFLTLLLLAAAMTAVMIPAVAHGDDSPSAAAEITGSHEISASDGANDVVAASEVAAPGTRIFVGNMLSAPVLLLMLLVVGVFAYRKKLSKQSLNVR